MQGFCMLSVYCSGTVVLAWRWFRLAGLWRQVFAFSVVAILCLNVVCVSIRLFGYSPLLAIASPESGSRFEIAQFLFASILAGLGMMAVRVRQAQRTH
jgi:hypothetical protein